MERKHLTDWLTQNVQQCHLSLSKKSPLGEMQMPEPLQGHLWYYK